MFSSSSTNNVTGSSGQQKQSQQNQHQLQTITNSPTLQRILLAGCNSIDYYYNNYNNNNHNHNNNNYSNDKNSITSSNNNNNINCGILSDNSNFNNQQQQQQQQRYYSTKQISIPAFLSTLLSKPINNNNDNNNNNNNRQLDNYLSSSIMLNYNKNDDLSYKHNYLLSKQLQNNNQQQKQNSLVSPTASSSSVVSTTISSSSSNDEQTVTTSGIKGYNSSNNCSITSSNNNNNNNNIRRSNLNQTYRSHHSATKNSLKSTRNISSNYDPQQETIIMNAHQNESHDSLAATMPLLSSYLKSKGNIKNIINNQSVNYKNAHSTNQIDFDSNVNDLTEPNNSSVRFGRVPKREKAKILAAMQKVNAHSLEKALSTVLEDEQNLMQSIIRAHDETCDYTKEKVTRLLDAARSRPIYAQCPQMTCPLNPLPPNQSISENNGANRLMEDFSERFSPAIHGVVEFAKRIPGFNMLAQEDQVTLLKAGVFEVLLVRLACMFDSQTNSLVCLNGLSLRRDSLHSASNARFLLDSMFEFAERLNSLRLTDHELGLFCAVVVIAPDRPGLRNVDLVQKINKRLEEILQKAIASNHHSHQNDLFVELTKKIPDLRTLNALHSEKLLGKSFGVLESSTTVANSNNNNSQESNNHNYQSQRMADGSIHQSQQQQQQQNVQPSQQPDSQSHQSESPDRWSSSSSSSYTHQEYSPSSLMDVDVHHQSQNLWIDNSKETNNNGSNGGNFGSPRSISSGISSDDGHHISSRKGSISSSSSTSSVSSAEPKLQYINSYVRGLNSSTINANVTSVVVEPHLMGHHPHYGHYKSRIDSPFDSGVESGKEQGGTPITTSSSFCSSPQSATEESSTLNKANKDCCVVSSDSEMGSEIHERQESIDDMPVLKRALQAPPLVNTNKLMDEAYRHHKKFRAATRITNSNNLNNRNNNNSNNNNEQQPDQLPHSPTTTTTSTNNNTNQPTNGLVSSAPTGVITSHSSSTNINMNSTLASTHSTLLKTLEQPSRYMNEQQLKRTDLIHNIIMNTEAVNTPASTAPQMLLLKDTGMSAHLYNHNQYQSPVQKELTTPAVLYGTQPNSFYHHLPVNTTGCPFTNSSNRMAHQPQYPLHHTQAYLSESQNQQPLLVIGSNGAAQPIAAHSPIRPSSSLSNNSISNYGPNGGQTHPYSHLHRCLTATVAPSSQGPILLQTAAASNHLSPLSIGQHNTLINNNEADCQPLNLSKKASSSNNTSPTPSPSLSSSSSPSGNSQQISTAASTTTTSSITSSMIKIES